jgi:hypothetical protein
MGKLCAILLALTAVHCTDIAMAADPVGRQTDEYPTETRADYVFACMNSNGGTQEALHRCSCAIDVVASILPFQAYEAAETVLRMQQTPGGGYLAQEFRVPASTEMVRALREAQAEADVRCF